MGSSIPIIPGPGSFLAGAGQAAGAIGQALQQRQEMLRQRAMQNAAFIAALVNSGRAAPETLASPDAQSLFQGLGIPQIQPEISGDLVQSRRKAQEIAALPAGSAQSQLATGVPTEAAATIDTARGQEAETAIRALAEIITPAQLRQYKGLLNPEAAEIAERVFLEKSKTELELQDPTRLEGQMQAEIRKSVLKRLPKDPAFAKIADYVAIGGLGYLLQEMETSARFTLGSRAQNTEKIRLVTAITGQAATAYRNAFSQWQQGLREGRRNALGIEGATMSQAEQSKRLNEFDADYTQRNPMPQFSDFLDATLSEGGLSQADFQETFRSLAHVPGGTQTQDPLARVTAAYQRGEITDADIDASTILTPQQKAQIKASKRK